MSDSAELARITTAILAEVRWHYTEAINHRDAADGSPSIEDQMAEDIQADMHEEAADRLRVILGIQMTRIEPAYRRLCDVREKIVAEARGSDGPIDPLLWAYYEAAHLELLTASCMQHLETVESIDKARKARE